MKILVINCGSSTLKFQLIDAKGESTDSAVVSEGAQSAMEPELETADTAPVEISEDKTKEVEKVEEENKSKKIKGKDDKNDKEMEDIEEENKEERKKEEEKESVEPEKEVDNED